jgi:hypothetical protein
MSSDRHCLDCCFFKVRLSAAKIYLQECQVNQRTKNVHSYDSCVDFMPRRVAMPVKKNAADFHRAKNI